MTIHDAVAQRFAGEHGVRAQPVYVAGEGAVHTYRIPALAATPAGTLLAFCEARRGGQSDHGDIDLVMRRSCDNGATWSPARVLAPGGGGTAGNPCPLVVSRTGAVVLLFCRNGGADTESAIMAGDAPPRTVWRTTSRDDGITWSEPQDISEHARRPGWRWYATGPCHGIEMDSGRLVAPCNHATGPAAEQMHSHVLLSDDAGCTWRIGGPLGACTDESTVVQLAGGGLYLNMRSYRGTGLRAWSRSADGGVTWSTVAEDASLPEPVCQASVLRIRMPGSGGPGAVAFVNPASRARENVTVRLSYDECAAWTVAKRLWPGPAAYADLVRCADGSLGCLFECGSQGPREAIVFARMSMDWLEGDAHARP